MEAITAFFAKVPLDYFVLGGLFLLLALDSLRSGIGRAAAVAVALPLAFVVYALVPSAYFLGAFVGEGMVAAGIFVALVAAMYVLVRRIGLDFLDGGMGQPVQAIIAGAAATVICAVIWLEADSLHALWNFGDQVQGILSDAWRFYMLLVAYAMLAFARG